MVLIFLRAYEFSKIYEYFISVDYLAYAYRIWWIIKRIYQIRNLFSFDTLDNVKLWNYVSSMGISHKLMIGWQLTFS